MSVSGAVASKDTRGNEPSMEEILASIRRIIADDQAANRDAKPAIAAAAPAPASVQAPPAPAIPMPAPVVPVVDDVLDLADVASVAPDLTPAEPISFDEPEPLPEMAPEPAPMIQAPVVAASTAAAAPISDNPEPEAVSPSDDALVSGPARTAATSAFQTLSRTVLLTNGRTLDDIVAEMMRPMLKEWLEDNLPSIVERLVRVEIERVARGR